MSSPVIRFEAQLPWDFVSTDPNYTAVHNFISNMQTLGQCYYHQVYDAPDGLTSHLAFYGYITSAQATTALGFLSTLNSGLSAPYTPVVCTSWSANTQP